MPADDRAPSIGILALQAGLITQKQLMECIELQRAGADGDDIEQILLRKGYLKSEQAKQLRSRKSSQVPAAVPQTATSARTKTTKSVAPAPPARETSARKATAKLPAVPPAETSSRTATAPASAVPQRETGSRKATSRTTAVKKTGQQPAVRSETSVRKSGGTTAVRKPTRVTPALSDPSAEGAVEAPLPSQRKGILLGAAFAGIPLAVLIGYLIVRAQQRAAEPKNKVVNATKSTAPSTYTERDPKQNERPKERPPVRLFRLNDDSDLARRWNRIVDEIGDGGPNSYARYFKEVQILVAEAKGTPHAARLQRVHDDMLAEIEAYAESTYSFIAEQSATLAKAGKYGEAVTAWDWFPNAIDPIGLFQGRIEESKKKTRRAGLEFFADLEKKSAEHAAAGRFEEAKRLMMQALEIGFPEVTDVAFKKVAEFSSRETEAARKAEEESIAQYEKEIRDQKEASAVLDTIRARFWELVGQRKPESVEAFLKAERDKRPGEPFAGEFRLLDEVYARVRDLFSATGDALRGRIGQTVTLSFVDQVRTVRLKDVSSGNLVYLVEGRELAESLWRLHSSELIRLAGSDALRQAVAHMLSDEFDRALELLAGAGDRGKPVASFIESSSGYAAKSEARIRERARKFEADREYEKAAREYSKLVSVPALRAKALKDRARAYFQAENFVAAVMDVEQLFDLDIVDREAIDVLNKSYERSALISKAIAIYEKAAKKLPEDAHVLAALVALYLKIHEYPKAREALANARKLKNWDSSLVSSAHLLSVDEKGAFPGKTFKIQLDRYIVETDVDQKFTNEVAQFMGKVYQMYKKVFPYRKNENLHFYVKIFATESEFATYYKAVTGTDIAKGHGKVLAYYMPLTKELVGWNAKDLLETLQHEGLHQFVDFFVDDCPNWFNEGFACIFETSNEKETKFNAERHQLAKAGIARKFLPSLRELLLMSRQAWNASEYTVYYYGQSWSFIYWLIKQGRRDILDKYFDELMKGRTGRQAFDAVFGSGKVNLEELEAKWKLAVFSDSYE